MKLNINKITGILGCGALALAFTACDDYLDITPPSQVTPDVYFTSADQLGAYTINYYKSNDDVGGRGSNPIPHYGIGGGSYSSFLDDDQGTDNENGTNNKFFDGTSKVKVGTSGGSWSFGYINAMNWFFETVLPKVEAGQVTGAEVLINHYLGEAYFLRANEYFGKLRSLGDFPIITTTQKMDREELCDSSRRQPRNVVARFILSDLDHAIELLSNGELTGKTRLTRDVALTLKARVALYEATFEKYFANTPFVPDKNAGWPGANMDYNKDFTYDNDTEVQFFLDQALEAAKQVIDRHPNLTANNKKKVGQNVANISENTYYNMWVSNDATTIDEVLMTIKYNLAVNGGHCVNQYIRGGRGYTQEFANCFLMENGLPIYDSNSGYMGDDFVKDTKEGRDWRWQLFMKAPGEYLYNGDPNQIIGYIDTKKNVTYDEVPGIWKGPNITTSTGYTKGKAWNPNPLYNIGGQDLTCPVIFRSAEAYLIYLEAAWEKYGDNLNADAWAVWKKLRVRAGLPEDPMVTINATDLSKEEEFSHDFGLYSAGNRITSKVLYNIRRERRCELMGEGMRWDDLIRWRALDQLKTQRFFKHGCKIFGPMFDKFPKNKLVYDNADDKKNQVSSPNDVVGGLNGNAQYWSLLRNSKSDDWYESGFTWRMAHYLDPIAESHFIETSDGDMDKSPIYQNPYWSKVHDTPAQQ